LAGPLFYLAYNGMLALWLARRRYSVVTAADADTLLGCTLATTANGAKLVFDAHEYFSELPEVVRRPFVQKAWAWVERTCIPRAARAYTVGPALAEVFTRIYHKPFGVVRNVPLAAAYQAFTRKTVPGRIVYTGAVNEGRGLEQLLEAFIQLPTYTAVICGDGPLKEALVDKVEVLQLTDRVRFTGWITPAELRQELSFAWIAFSALVPQGESYRLSLTNKFFDYIQAGVPQLCPALPEYEAILAQHPVGFAVPCTAEGIADGIQLLANENIYQQKEAACMQAAPVFTWENEQVALLKIYQGLER
jgi:glycosyltransferase involved in cell wall biosynthesis